MNKNTAQLSRPLLIVFIFWTVFFISGKNWLEKKGIDQSVLLAGNLLLFVVTLISFFIVAKTLRSPDPQAFVRAMYGGVMLRLFLIVLAAFIYIMVQKKNVNKPALIFCAGLYIAYTAIEINVLLKLFKQKRDA